MKKEEMSKLRSIINDIFHEGTASFKKNNEYSLFKDIYAHDDIKQIIVMALKAQQPVHMLLTGEPGCGKTQFLENIKGYYKDKAYFTIGAHSTKAGMLDIYNNNEEKTAKSKMDESKCA